jgi:L-Ala-D/L-Glu epimerase
MAAAEVIPYGLEFREPYVSARGAIVRREMVLLRVRGEDGIEGLGEAVPLALRGGDPLQLVVAELCEWAARPKGRGEELSAPARCAITTALADIAARREDAPLWRSLGAEAVEPVRCNASLTADKPEAVAERALGWAQDGFRSFKLKVGMPGDAEQVQAVRDAIGPEAAIRVDANGVWTPEEAEERLDAMGNDGLELAEQPCGSLTEMSEARRRVDLPLAADESVADVGEARVAAEQGACDLATAKLSKVGGIAEALAIGAELPVYLSSALDGPIGIAAAAHAAQALRSGVAGAVDAGVAHGLATERLFATTIASRSCELRDGLLHLPDGPGLGVEIDDAALEQHRL